MVQRGSSSCLGRPWVGCPRFPRCPMGSQNASYAILAQESWIKINLLTHPPAPCGPRLPLAESSWCWRQAWLERKRERKAVIRVAYCSRVWGAGLWYSQALASAPKGGFPLGPGIEVRTGLTLAPGCGSGFSPWGGAGSAHLAGRKLYARLPSRMVVPQLTTAASLSHFQRPPLEGGRVLVRLSPSVRAVLALPSAGGPASFKLDNGAG